MLWSNIQAFGLVYSWAETCCSTWRKGTAWWPWFSHRWMGFAKRFCSHNGHPFPRVLHYRASLSRWIKSESRECRHPLGQARQQIQRFHLEPVKWSVWHSAKRSFGYSNDAREVPKWRNKRSTWIPAQCVSLSSPPILDPIWALVTSITTKLCW